MFLFFFFPLCITAYVNLGGYNVISVDWGNIAKNKNYMLPVLMTTKIGNLLARIIDNFAALGLIEPLDVHLIGHSLGAHIAGTCGASVVSGRIGRITGENNDKNRTRFATQLVVGGKIREIGRRVF